VVGNGRNKLSTCKVTLLYDKLQETVTRNSELNGFTLRSRNEIYNNLPYEKTKIVSICGNKQEVIIEYKILMVEIITLQRDSLRKIHNLRNYAFFRQSEQMEKKKEQD